MLKEIIDESKRKKLGYEDLKINIKRISRSQEQYDIIEEVIDFVYYLGIEDGECIGYKESLKENNVSEDERNDIYENGFSDGVNEGMNDGHSNGYDEGHSDGYSEGHSDGHEEGYSEGYDNGYEKGYSEGYEDAANN